MRDKILTLLSSRIINCIGTKAIRVQGIHFLQAKLCDKSEGVQKYLSTQFILRQAEKEMLCPRTGDHRAATCTAAAP